MQAGGERRKERNPTKLEKASFFRCLRGSEEIQREKEREEERKREGEKEGRREGRRARRKKERRKRYTMEKKKEEEIKSKDRKPLFP